MQGAVIFAALGPARWRCAASRRGQTPFGRVVGNREQRTRRGAKSWETGLPDEPIHHPPQVTYASRPSVHAPAIPSHGWRQSTHSLATYVPSFSH